MLIDTSRNITFLNERTPSIQLALNGQGVLLHNFLATAKIKREAKDMSGQASSTKNSDKGIKAKTLTISGLIPFRNKKWLLDLVNLAEAVDKKGEQVIYRISNISAEAINMRKGVFSGDLNITEQSVQGWNISFTLKEVDSVSEKKAKRIKKAKVKTQTEKAPATKTQQEQKPAEQRKEEVKEEKQQEDNSNTKALDDFLGKWG
ncbi:hypothetical protein QJU93_10030 [Pasteurella skyensis]|uniref:Uncharacterized protein n=1 Tax=Phocoenobacter skyensis TaxID=97481 RepID=A0AAJ6NBF0_9PAST|nr:hypothetical protein [Pasteurella skyensis]MDP8173693.1 hypothetical protein [Pasteurella skyensis]MDP8178061.1 hypothetical protein [Pasteurella skyensis]